MLVSLLLALLIPAILLRTTKHSRRYCLPPGDLGFPVMGQTFSLLGALRSNTDDQWFRARINKYGPVSKMSVLGSPIPGQVGRAKWAGTRPIYFGPV
ncbi:hypothetical protein PR202_gb16021 [Eleusine coracana subsp. coracana]|uniref:Uncharacterized protein n=1 Tax=Eleusine coracana subsp. coracana TaxID=191504 RepID=A0AAV5EZT7_ELECO|nr:hypothetical protein PR202_gb16021 [Eleusine coracana subsp. coracana]